MTTPPEIVLFIGAGASDPLGLPTTSEFSQILASQLSENNKTLWHQFDSQKDAEEVIQNINALGSFTNVKILNEYFTKQINISDITQKLEKENYINRMQGNMKLQTIQNIKRILNSYIILSISNMGNLFENCRMLNEEIFNLIFSTY